jgi:hypothetical protein
MAANRDMLMRRTVRQRERCLVSVGLGGKSAEFGGFVIE